MDPLKEHLRLLAGDLEQWDQLPARLAGLGAGLRLAVPSLLAASIELPDLGIEVEVVQVGPRSTPVLSSLALRVGGAWLILRAGSPGTFLLLAEDYAGRVVLDRHLSRTADGALERLGAFHREVGALVEQGLSVAEASRRLTTPGIAARAGRRSPPAPVPPPSPGRPPRRPSP